MSPLGDESKVSFIIIDGVIEEIVITNVRGKKPLSGNDFRNLKVFLRRYGNDIVTKWVNYFVYRKEVGFEKITHKLK
ncbi:hypothetical protein GCM10028791_36700 [Echinicola sediminis]